MVNSISVCANVRIHGKIARQPSGKLWYIYRAIDEEGSGKVDIPVNEVRIFLNISRTRFYRWLKEGKEAGAFQSYRSIGKGMMRIYLGSKTRVCKKLGVTDWESSTEIEIEQLFNNSEEEAESLRELITKCQTYWMQKKSIEAAKEEEKIKVRKKRNRGKPCQPYKKIRGANGKPTSQLRAGQKYKFSRHHLPTGASQEEIGESLGICDRTVRRHQEGIKRVQMMYKVNRSEVKLGTNLFTGEIELFYVHPTGEKVPVFKRGGEYYRYGCNLYDLKFTLHSEFTQRLKYKFSLLQEEIPLEAIQWSKNKQFAHSPLFSHLYMSQQEIKEKLNKKYDLDSLDKVAIYIYCQLKTKSFGKFMIAVKKELERLKKEKYRMARQGELAA